MVGVNVILIIEEIVAWKLDVGLFHPTENHSVINNYQG
jgi:hypothetical protein